MINVPVSYQTGVWKANEWLIKQGLVFPRDWYWYNDRECNTYVFTFGKAVEKVAVTFALKFS